MNEAEGRGMHAEVHGNGQAINVHIDSGKVPTWAWPLIALCFIIAISLPQAAYGR